MSRSCRWRSRRLRPEPAAGAAPLDNRSAGCNNPRISAEAPLSEDGRLWWDGTVWRPVNRRRLQPTAWTLPLHAAVAGLWALNALNALISAFDRSALVAALAEARR